ncbi:uncharacterized protein LOC107417658 [Ziziphus jujuba]|uniref:Uncharacterized protein LOC107417658 n=2 Tax=Ziziphus jujuba TaxID=326968 RepID=A0A6P3ZR38_ZIZJJ|nr:uncharacterized protein LOC107417658 [Ziziphus jujuba]KAH7527830.1 hypothetical protein FEM48_Zijuj05G0008100 [Ziziphus jujuba var. spinosa]
MEGYVVMGRGKGMGMATMRTKLKRKEVEELDQVSHDFSDFSLSSPARKIRRLDAELPPIMEEEEPEILPPFSSSSSSSSSPSVGVGEGNNRRGGLVIEELNCDPDPSPPCKEDKAIVLFNPANPLLIHRSPSTLSFSVDSGIISGFKDQFIRSTQYGQQKSDEEDETVSNSNECRAVVPYAPSQFLPPGSGMEVSQAMTEPPEELMEGGDTMEIEEGLGSLPQAQPNGGFGGMGLHQWQQQHCMIPQPPQQTSTPITWFR